MSRSNPATRAAALTKSDSTVIAPATRGLYVGGGGDVAVRILNASGVAASVTFANVPAGTILPIVCDQLLSTGTTATNVLGLW